MATGFDVPLTPIIDTVTGSVSEIGRIFLRRLAEAVGALAPITAQYWLSTSDPTLSNERNLGALATGYVKITQAIGIAVPSTVAGIPQADVTGLAAALAAKATLPIAESDVTSLVADLALKAPLASPTFTGVPAAPTAAAATNTTQLATTAMVQAAIAAAGAVAGAVAGSAFSTATQTLTTGTFTAVALNAEDFQVGALHSTSVNNTRVTIATTGKYLFVGAISYVPNATGQRIAVLRANGATYGEKLDFPSNGGACTFMAQVTKLWSLVAGDYVELIAFQDSGGNLNIGDGTNRFLQCSLQWTRIS
jgi:hypothetical protein